MRFNILSLFPEIFPGPLLHSITGKALKKKLFKIRTYNIRDFADKKSKSVDDTPFGGGAGMILRPDVLQNSLDHVKKKIHKNHKIVYLTPAGKRMNQKIITKFLRYEEIVIICGRYEGVDERFLTKNCIDEFSVGDFILSCGEFASFILIDACVRLIPEVLGNKNSLNSESFNDYLLEYPQYTKPVKWSDIEVPELLRSGNHKKISEWRLKKSIEKTKKVRPDLFKLYLDYKKESK